MQIDILTLFPKMFDGVLSESMLKRARAKRLLDIRVHNIRDWTSDKHKTADDYPYGGGPGMVIKVEPVYRALRDILKGKVTSNQKPVTRKKDKKIRVILLTPQGERLDQRLVKELAKSKRLVLICGHYEGVDERVRPLVTDEVSIGDYILTCGEIPATVIIDSVARLIPGVVGDPKSIMCESFEKNLLEYPQYTKPRVFKGMAVPDVLTSGDHGAIEAWRMKEAVKRTKKRRPDLLAKETHG